MLSGKCPYDVERQADSLTGLLVLQVLHETPSLSRFAKAFDDAHVPFITGVQRVVSDCRLQSHETLLLSCAAGVKRLLTACLIYRRSGQRPTCARHSPGCSG
jgi:hypothetical protein